MTQLGKSPRSTAKGEWQQNWTLIAASMAGLSFAAIASATMGLFIEPLSEEFAWTRAQITIGISIYAITGVILAPFAGALIDRWGARSVGLPGVFVAAVAFSCMSFANGSIAQWILLWCIYSITAVVIKNTVWTAAVSSVFTASRGLALAFTLSGSAITLTIAPLITVWLIDDLGWRSAYLSLGIGWGIFVLFLLVPFFFDSRDRDGSRKVVRSPGSTKTQSLPGLSMSEALKSSSLLKIGLAALLTLIPLSAITIHSVPIITERVFSGKRPPL